ncbi:uncharacterized protein N0V89_011316 [Didymosphaeria variabile]|uniref:Ankyrin n=1 Tax=Didymosphaeria variabile TaxID=1932322 RepID=A0A9W8X9J1_9PLEO|nr:uncharacterized protein N0V89_011316 [Didymosphaeria variabile]KAJ4345187.1 hypothetical protein N0V89_011316 [Didymosphaeria variabile]
MFMPKKPLSLTLAKRLMDGGILVVLRKLFEYMPDLDISFKRKPVFMTVAEYHTIDVGSVFSDTLRVAAVAGNLATVQLLIKHGVSLDLNLCGESALDGAARLNQLPVLKALLKAGAKPTVEGVIHGGSVNALRLILDKSAVAIEDSALEQAVKVGNEDFVEAILERTGSSIENSNALSYACDIGNLYLIDKLLQAGSPVNHLVEAEVYPRRKRSPLLIAVKRGHERTVRKLLENGADPNLKTDDDLTFPLIAATHEGCLEIVQLLLQHGADVNCEMAKQSSIHQRWAEPRGMSLNFDQDYLDDDESEREHEIEGSIDDEVASHASQQDSFHTKLSYVLELLSLSIPSRSLSMTDGIPSTPLQLACEYGASDIARELIAHGALVVDEANTKPQNLFSGCFIGDWSTSMREVLQMLCEYALHLPQWDDIGLASFAKAAIARCSEGFELLASYFPPSPILLSFACMCGSTCTARTCVEQGILIDTLLPHGLAPLHLAALFLQDDLVAALLKDGADPNLPDALGQTPLTRAISGLQKLLQVGEDEVEDLIPLHIISFERVVQLLLDSGTDVDSGSTVEDKALHLVCSMGHVPVARSLIEKSKEIDQWAGGHGTPLFAALDGDRPSIIEILLEHGADPNQTRELDSSDPRGRFKHLHKSSANSHRGPVAQTAVEAALGKESPLLLRTFLSLAPDLDVSDLLMTALKASFRRPGSLPPYSDQTGRSPSEKSDFELVLNARKDLYVSEKVMERLLELGNGVQSELLKYALSRRERGMPAQLIGRATSRLRNYSNSSYESWRRTDSEEFSDYDDSDQGFAKDANSTWYSGNEDSDRHSEKDNDQGHVGEGESFTTHHGSSKLDAVLTRGDLFAERRLFYDIKDAELENSNVDHALILASETDREPLARLLLEKGASASRSINGRNALSAASYAGSISVLKLLLNAPGFHIELTDQYGRTPLWWAAAGGNVQIIRLLLNQCQSNPSKADWLDRSPAMIAAMKGNYSAMDLLLSKVFKRTDLEYDATLGAFAINGRQPWLSCDICTAPIQLSHHHYHCNTCSGGDWDMCKECKEGGASCHDLSHELVERVMRDGAWVEHKGERLPFL